jgi:hypothetical protein
MNIRHIRGLIEVGLAEVSIILHGFQLEAVEQCLTVLILNDNDSHLFIG